MIDPRDQTDPRFLRPHPDALPRWRRCPTCPDGQDVHELNAHNFYEDASRYPWQAARFSKRCRSCTSSRNSLANRAARPQRSERQRQWRAIDRQNRVQAAVFYTAAQQAIETERKQNRFRSKVAKAKLKREMLRLYGPRDGIKALIAERSRMYAQRHLQSATGRALGALEAQQPLKTLEAAQGTPGGSGERQTPAQAMAELQRLREQHRRQQEAGDA
jgi:hypothetical protein